MEIDSSALLPNENKEAQLNDGVWGGADMSALCCWETQQAFFFCGFVQEMQQLD